MRFSSYLHWPSSTRSSVAKIMDSALDRFVPSYTGVGPLALWSSVKSSPLRLPGGRFCRLDYLEVSPRSRKVRLGAFMMTLVA